MGSDQERHQGRHGPPKVFRLISIGLVIAAVVKELRTPAEERTWNGVVAGFVPYDFRVPSVARIRDRVWAPEDPHLLKPHPFGVGWTLNVGRVVALIRQRLSSEG
jgi:hypothetical protein